MPTRWLIGGSSSGHALSSDEPMLETIYGGVSFCGAGELGACIGNGTGVVEGADELTYPRDDRRQHSPSLSQPQYA